MTDGRLAFLNVTASLVIDQIDALVGPNDVVLELLETIKAHGWDLARCLDRLPRPEELGSSWLAEVYEPGLRALHEAGLSCPHEDATEADSFLWLYQRRRALWMRGARATYRDAVYDIRHTRKLSRRERRELRRAAARLETVSTRELVAS